MTTVKNIWYSVRVVDLVVATNVADKAARASTRNSRTDELSIGRGVTNRAFLDNAMFWSVHGIKNPYIISFIAADNIVAI